MTKVRLLNGLLMHYEVNGTGDPLVLIAGTGRDHEGWALHVPKYSKHFKVVTYDHVGTGLSDKPQSLHDYSVPKLAEHLHLLMEAVGISRAHVIGQSLGSAVAQELAISHPDKVRSLVLCATWGRTVEWLSRMFDFMFELVEKGDVATFVKVAYLLLVSPKFFEDNKDRLESLEKQRLAMYSDIVAQRALLGHLYADKGHNTLERLHLIKAPTLVLAGESDIQIPLRYSRKVYERIPGCKLHIFLEENASHFFYLEKFEDFLSVTEDFLGSCP